MMEKGTADLLAELRKISRDKLILEAEKQYNPKLHEVASKSIRPDKPILVPSATEKDEFGQPVMKSGTARVVRAPIAFQQYIISQKAAFARGNGVTLSPSDPKSELFSKVNWNWNKNKMNYVIGESARRQMAETQVAVIFYGDQVESVADFRLKHKIVSPAKGDKLTPFFDPDTDDLVAFGREYKSDGKTRYDLYFMNDLGFCDIIRFINKSVTGDLLSTEWEQFEEIINTPYRNLPIVYWEQDYPECDITNELSKEFETGFSDFLTQMGYSADPILFGRGDSLSMPAQGSPGKFITGSGDADLKFVTPENATEARELQFRMLQKYIFSLNRAVLLDLDAMKDLGDVSGAALDRYLIDAYMEATNRQQGDWGIGVQRLVNFMLMVWKDLLEIDLDLEIEVIFSKYSIEDIKERIELAMKANGGLPVVSHLDSIEMAGTSEDPQQTLNAITAQNNEEKV